MGAGGQESSRSRAGAGSGAEREQREQRERRERRSSGRREEDAGEEKEERTFVVPAAAAGAARGEEPERIARSMAERRRVAIMCTSLHLALPSPVDRSRRLSPIRFGVAVASGGLDLP
eukprot:COSAG04_NODE_20323_length_396_cov_0.794613_1_plen_117_part_10